MASANKKMKLLEDEISCFVCLKIYEDPHVLKECLHTFCFKCIKRLEKDGEVQCPDCRVVTDINNVKADFKTKRFIDIHNNKQQEVPNTPPDEQICGFCQAVGAVDTSHCVDCDLPLCDRCVQGHKASKALRSHTIKPISLLIKGLQSKYKDTVSEMEEQVKKINKQILNVCTAGTLVKHSNTEQLGDLRKFTQDGINSLLEQEKTLGKLVNDANQNLLEQLTQSESMLQQQKKDLLSKLILMKDLMESQDIKTLQDAADSLNESMTEDIQNIKEKLQSTVTDVRSTVTVKKGDKCDEKGSIEVSIGGSQCGSKQIQPVLQGLYQDLWTKKLTQNLAEKLAYYPDRLRLINNQLWCAGNGGVYVYNQKCKLVNEIKLKQLNDATSLSRTPKGHIVVACKDEGGLHLLTSSGQYIQEIAEGSFADVDSYNGVVYVLDYQKGRIIKLSQNDSNTWSQIGQYQLHYEEFDVDDKLCVNSTGLYITSLNNDCIYIYDTQGEFQTRIGETGSRPGQFSQPLLCNVDSSGCILLADYDNHRLQVYDNTGHWHVISLPQQALESTDAVVGEDGYVWVITYEESSLLKLKLG